MGRVVVLDTSCVRGTPNGTLRALLEAGFVLRISGLALDELAVRYTTPTATSDDRRRLSNRLAALRTTVDDRRHGVAPTHAALVDKIGGRAPFVVPGEFERWHARMIRAWDAMADGDTPEAHPFLSDIARYVEETGADWVDTAEAAKALHPGRELPEAVLVRFAATIFLSGSLSQVRLPRGARVAERFDAYGKVCGLHAARGGRPDAREATRNDAIDLNMMQHLAEDVVLLTKDYGLIEVADACGTVQAPWVRTAGELLAGHVPKGPPWSFSAKKASAKHRPRARQKLGELDAEADARFRVAKK